MKNKKGFTLIELLAVIVILAIIALIAVPIILNMINSARKSAARSAALGYIDAIEYNNGFASLGSDAEVSGYTAITSGDVSKITSTLGSHLKGKAPTSGSVVIDTNGKVTSATNLCFNGYAVNYDGKDATVDGKCSGESSELTSTFGGTIDKSKQYTSSSVEQKGLIGVAYLDPSDLTATCTATSEITNTNTGCKKFYIFDDSNNQYKMIMDRNTTALVAWNSSGNNADGMNEVATALSTDTSGWEGSPRLITADEVAHITGADTAKSWTSSSSTSWFCLDTNEPDTTNYCAKSQGTSSYKWLFDYTNGCTSYGCDTADSSTYGYWTSDAVVGDSIDAWYVHRIGNLGIDIVDSADYYGVRPVITISKSKLQ